MFFCFIAHIAPFAYTFIEALGGVLYEYEQPNTKLYNLFSDVHYNPHGCPHPYHSGDLPPLFGAGGYAFSAVLTDRFTVEEVIGKTVIIHSSPDDFTTQPSGNAGAKIACGEIVPRRQR